MRFVALHNAVNPRIGPQYVQPMPPRRPFGFALRLSKAPARRRSRQLVSIAQGQRTQHARESRIESARNLILKARKYLPAPRFALPRSATQELSIMPAALLMLRKNHEQSAALGGPRVQANIRTASRHVGCDRHMARPARHCDDLRFLRFIAGIQDHG